jgi:hypothetical protein
VALLRREHVDEGTRGAHEHVDTPHLVVPGRESAVRSREIDARRALAAELDELAEQKRRLRGVEVPEVARAGEVLEIEGDRRVGVRARLEERRLARANLVGVRGKFGIPKQRRGERAFQPEDSGGLGRSIGGRRAGGSRRLVGGQIASDGIRRGRLGATGERNAQASSQQRRASQECGADHETLVLE